MGTEQRLRRDCNSWLTKQCRSKNHTFELLLDREGSRCMIHQPSTAPTICVLMVVTLFAFSDESIATAEQPDFAVSYEAELLKTLGVPCDLPSLLAFVERSTPTDMEPKREPQRFHELVKLLSNERFVERQKAASELRGSGLFYADRIRLAARNANPEVRKRLNDLLQLIAASRSPEKVAGLRAAANLLGKAGGRSAGIALLRLLPAAIDEELEVEIWFALDSIAKRTHADEFWGPYLKDPLASRRAAAGFLAARRVRREGAKEAEQMLLDRDPFVRFRVAQGLLSRGDYRAIPALIALMTDLHTLTLALQAEELLRWVARGSGPKEELRDGSRTARQKCQQAWSEWWKSAEKKVDLRDLLVGKRRPFLAVLQRGIASDVVGSDGTSRWQILAKGQDVRFEQWLSNDQVVISLAGDYDQGELRKQRGGQVRVYDIAARTVEKHRYWDIRMIGTELPPVARLLPLGRLLIADFRWIELRNLDSGNRERRETQSHNSTRNGAKPIYLPIGYRDGRVLAKEQQRNLGITALIEHDVLTGKEVYREPLQLEAMTRPHPLPDGTWLRNSNPATVFGRGHKTVVPIRGSERLYCRFRSGQYLGYQLAGQLLFVCNSQAEKLQESKFQSPDAISLICQILQLGFD